MSPSPSAYPATENANAQSHSAFSPTPAQFRFALANAGEVFHRLATAIGYGELTMRLSNYEDPATSKVVQFNWCGCGVLCNGTSSSFSVWLSELYFAGDSLYQIVESNCEYLIESAASEFAFTSYKSGWIAKYEQDAYYRQALKLLTGSRPRAASPYIKQYRNAGELLAETYQRLNRVGSLELSYRPSGDAVNYSWERDRGRPRNSESRTHSSSISLKMLGRFNAEDIDNEAVHLAKRFTWQPLDWQLVAASTPPLA
jgi:hypothetical protein